MGSSFVIFRTSCSVSLAELPLLFHIFHAISDRLYSHRIGRTVWRSGKDPSESESKLWTTQFRLLSFLPVIVDVFESISPLRDIKNHPKYDQDIKKRNEI